MAASLEVGHLESMNTDSMVLSQQTISWLLQAAGLVAAHKNRRHQMRVSPSTVKSALNRQPVLTSWQLLVDELLSAFNLYLIEYKRLELATRLRDWDQHASQLDTLGLDLPTRLPTLLLVAAPQIGIRFGALAALEHPNSTESFPVSDWLCKPLSPSIFGHAVEWLFRKHHPMLETWVARYKLLPGMDRTTVEDWRSEQVKIPTVGNLDVVAKAMGQAEDSARSLLRIARILTVLRHDIAGWGSPLLAQDFDDTVASYAQVTRQALTTPTVVVELADLYAMTLEGPMGVTMLKNLCQIWGTATSEASPHVIGGKIREAASRVRAGGDQSELNWVKIAQVIDPLPPLLGLAMHMLGVKNGLIHTMKDPLQFVQEEWQLQMFLGQLGKGAPLIFSLKPNEPTISRTPSPQIQDLAKKMAKEQRQLCYRPEAPPPNPNDPIMLTILLGNLLNGEAGVSHMIDMMNRANGVAAIPSKLEAFVSAETLVAFPHLMAYRAKRFADEGRDYEAITWLQQWGEQSTLHSQPERRAAAEAAIAMAHRHIDKTRQFRAFLKLKLDAHIERLPQDSGSKSTNIVANCRHILCQVMTMADQLMGIAAGLLYSYPGTVDEVERIVMLLPLAIRLDFLTVATSNEETVILTRAEGLAKRLQAADRALPEHGPPGQCGHCGSV